MDIGVEDRGRGPFVFTDHWPDLGRGKAEKLWRLGGNDRLYLLLLRRVAPGMEQGDDDPFYPACKGGLNRGRDSLLQILALGALPVRTHSQRQAKDHVTRDQRVGPVAV